MTIALYDLMQDEKQHPTLVCEGEYVYDAKELSNPGAITHMLNEVFHADRKSEEHLYLVAMNAANEVLGVFDASHGTEVATLVDPRAIFTRCMLVGAASAVIAVHNHPSHNATPSHDDIKTGNRVREAGKIMGIPLLDFIVDAGENYFSFAREGII